MRVELLFVFGSSDPHAPLDGTSTIVRTLASFGVRARIESYDAEHAFMGAEGARYDSAASDAVWASAARFSRRKLGVR